MIVWLDYETYSECDLSEAGAWRYSEDPSTEVLCFSWAIDSGEPKAWTPGMPLDPRLVSAIKDGAEVHAYNANFERAITENVVRRQLPGFPIPEVWQWHDTMALVACVGLPLALRDSAAALGTPQKKDVDGGRLLAIFSYPSKAGKRTRPEDAPDKFKRLVEYCLQDIRAERAVHLALPIQNLEANEQAVWTLDSVINSRGVKADLEMAKGAMRIAGVVEKREQGRLFDLTNGDIDSQSQRVRLKKWLHARGVKVDKVGAADLEAAMPTVTDPKVRAVIEVCCVLSKSSTSKYARMLSSASPRDHRIRGTLQYGAAHTLRWGGRLIQVQNFPRPKMDVSADLDLIRAGDHEALRILYGDEMAVLRDALRNALVAAEGKTFAIVDLASIEARVLGWLADDPRYLEAFRKGLDLYKVTASFIFGVRYEDVTDEQRFVGKQAVLGLGYGMWVDTFDETCRKAGRVLERDLLQKAVEGYRILYAAIPKYWRDVEAHAIAAIAHRRPARLRQVVFDMEDHYLTIKLPSGRRLWYPHASIAKSRTKWGERWEIRFKSWYGSKGWLPSSTYGGRLTENIDQAISRDLLAFDLLEAEKAKLNPMMHVHDEMVCEVPAEANEPHKKLERIMTTNPSWATSLPLGAKGFCSPIYVKG